MIEVVAAIICNNQGEILIARRKEGKAMAGYWEFPGGKVEKGENPQDSLVRELKEEMNIKVKVKEYFDTNIHDYDKFKIKLIAYLTEIEEGNMILKDHDAIEWVQVDQLKSFNLAPADIPFVAKLQNKT